MVAPKVTILIPTYNQADLVKRAVDSALSQSYAPLEVIVCDDSRDNKTKELLVPIEGIDNRFIYIQNRSRLGRVENYKNALYQCATGEWALMLDGDDFLIDNKFISDAMEVIMQDPTIVMVQGGGEIRKSDDSMVGYTLLATRIPDVRTRGEKKKLKNDCNVICGVDYVKDFSRKRHFLHLAALFNVSVAKSIDFYRRDILSSDLESFMRLALHGNVLLIKRPVGVWWQHSTNAGGNASMEEIILNSCWVNSVTHYATAHKLLPKRTLKRWAARIRTNEMIGAFSRETQRCKEQKKNRLYMITFSRNFVKKHPYLILHPVFVKKLICSLI